MLVDFYHLASSPIERVLPQICEKVLASGEGLLVVADPPMLDQIDGWLWSYARDAFLPHGRDGAKQPILLSESTEAANGATHIVIADGQWRDEALAFQRIFYFFDASRLDEARANWRSLKGRNEVDSRYWKQDERGKWVQGS
jgi:DNA polymerase-3 subunit chi